MKTPKELFVPTPPLLHVSRSISLALRKPRHGERGRQSGSLLESRSFAGLSPITCRRTGSPVKAAVTAVRSTGTQMKRLNACRSSRFTRPLFLVKRKKKKRKGKNERKKERKRVKTAKLSRNPRRFYLSERSFLFRSLAENVN